MKYCKRINAIVITRYNLPNTDRKLLSHLRCKQWDCPYCAKKNKSIWRKAIYEFLKCNPDKFWSFHTFTIKFRKDYNREQRLLQSINQIKRRWEALLKRLKRRYGKFSYVRVLEMHEHGGLHIHLLASFRIPENDLGKYKRKSDGKIVQYVRWLKKSDAESGNKSVLVSLGFGYITSSENAFGNEAQVTSYITKYLTKEDERLIERLKDNRIRVVQTSRDIKSPMNETSEYSWDVRKAITCHDYLLTAVITDVNEKKDITINDLEDYGGVYPDYE